MIRRLLAVVALTAIMTMPAAANLVVNGSFEDPDVVSVGVWGNVGDVLGSGWILDGSDWNAGNQPDLTIYNNTNKPWGNIVAADGVQFVMMPQGNHNAVEIYQDIQTVAGKSYKVRFAVKMHPDYTAWGNSQMKVSFGVLDEIITTPTTTWAATGDPASWTYVERTVVATSSSTKLDFRLWFMEAWLDDVSVVEVPGKLVANGGFEDPVVPSSWPQVINYDTAGQVIGTNGWLMEGIDWDTGNQPDLTLYSNIQKPWGPMACPEGNQFLMMPTGNHNAVEISQQINTVPGTRYKVRFAAKSSPNNGAWTNAEINTVFGSLDETITLPATSWATVTDPASWGYFERTITADSSSTLLNFRRWSNDVWLDDVSVTEESSLPPTVAPTFTPDAGMFSGPILVTINCADAGATIRYTTDGTDPSNGTIITAGSTVAINNTATLKARASSNAPASDVISAGYVIEPNATYNRPASIKYADNVEVDGDLSDWNDVQWAPLDKDYDMMPYDIESGSAYAAKWGANGDKIYVAVKVNDAYHRFMESYGIWDQRDAVEIFVRSSSNTGDYQSDQDPAQQYIIGFTGSEDPVLWTAIGGANAIPETAGFSAAGSISGQWLQYEAAITPFAFFSMTGDGLVHSVLQPGRIIGLDVCAVSHDGSSYSGMKSENDMAGKAWNLFNIGKHLLVRSVGIGDVKNAGEDSTVTTSGIVSAVFSDCFYIESVDRTYGIRVNKTNHGRAVREVANVEGKVTTLESGERCIAATGVSASSGTTSILPLGLTNKALGGGAFGLQQGVAGASGLNNIGLLVKTTGRVTTKDTSASPKWFKIDDGSGVSVTVFGAVPSGTPYVAVIGVSSCEKPAGSVERAIYATDILTISQ